MRNTLLLAGLLAIVGIPAGAADVQVDYDNDVDFSSFETFQFIEVEGGDTLQGTNPLMHGRVVEIVEKTLTDVGLRMVETDPDLLVTYHAKTEERSTFTTSGFGYGWGRGPRRWGGGFGGGSSITQEHEHAEGTLIVDAWNPQDQQLVWRGTSSQTLKGKPEKQIKQIENALADMAKKFEKLKAGERR